MPKPKILVPQCLEVSLYKINGSNCSTVKTDYLELVSSGIPHLYDLSDPQPDTDQDFMICTIESIGGNPPTAWKMILRHIEGSPSDPCWGHFQYLYQSNPDDEPAGNYSRSGYDDLVVVDECAQFSVERSAAGKTPPKTLMVTSGSVSQLIEIVPPGFDRRVPWCYTRCAGAKDLRCCTLIAQYSPAGDHIGWTLEIVTHDKKLTRFVQEEPGRDPRGDYISTTAASAGATATVQ